MLDRDLAELYQVETKVLKQAIRRNINRFPEDFMFELTEDEFAILRSQIVTSSWGGIRYAPMAFHRSQRCHALKCFEDGKTNLR
ncbi:MAG: ORF6N domain-containing protein [Desulfatirhabdiaceae bacterium]